MKNKVEIYKGYGLVRQSVEKLKSNKVQKIHLEKALERFSNQHGCKYELVDIYEEKKSGRKAKYHLRNGFHNLEKKVDKIETDFVIFESVNRLGRWDIKNKEFVNLCFERGVKVIFADYGLLDLRKKGDRIKFGLDSILAEEGSNEISEKVKTKGRTNAVFYGKDKNTTPVLGLLPHELYTGQYVPCDKGRKIINEMVAIFLDTQSYSETAEALNDKGYRNPDRWTKGGGTNSRGERVPSRKISGGKFTADQIKKYLTNKKLRGWNEFKDEYDQFEDEQDENGIVRWQYGYAREYGPIISEEDAIKIDLLVDKYKHKRRGTSKYLLSDILETPEGIKYIGGGGTNGSGNPYHNYQVPKRFREKGLYYKNEPAKEIEAIIINRAKQYLKESELLTEVINKFISNRHIGIAPLKEQEIELKKEVKELTLKCDKYNQKIEALVLDEGINAEAIKTLTTMKVKVENDLKTKMDVLKEKQKRLHQMCNTGREKAFKDTLKNVLEVFDKAELSEKRKLLHMVFPKIIVFPDKCLELQVNLGLKLLQGEEIRSNEKKKWLGRRDSNPRPTD